MLRTTALLLCFAATPAFAGDALIEKATAAKSGDAWRFSVTIRHGDTGWDHYADAWRVVDQEGGVYGTRILHHPHENEQPFTRSLGGVSIPGDVDTVWIEARDSVHGWNADKLELSLPK
ncbi:MAG: hypothetical protein AAF401_08130 [Pseudomonadota bacterium]